MADERTKGVASFAVNFEPGGQTPLDARLLVPTKEALINPNTYSAKNYYEGMMVVVQDINEAYILKDSSKITEADYSGWEKVGGSDIIVEDNLNSLSSTSALSANMGRELKETIDSLTYKLKNPLDLSNNTLDLPDTTAVEEIFGNRIQFGNAVLNSYIFIGIVQANTWSSIVTFTIRDTGTYFQLTAITGSNDIITGKLNYADNEWTNGAFGILTMLDTSDILDNLTSQDSTKALSANQGRILNNKISNAFYSLKQGILLDGDETTISDSGQIEDILGTVLDCLDAIDSSKPFKGTIQTNNGERFIIAGNAFYNTNAITLNTYVDYDTTYTLVASYSSYSWTELTITKNKILSTLDVVDGLNSTESNMVLSANQGKALNDKITALGNVYRVKGTKTNISDVLALTDAKVGDVWNVTNAFTLNGAPYPANTNVVCVTDTSSSDHNDDNWDAIGGTVNFDEFLVDNLESTDTHKALTANQGKVLNESKLDYYMYSETESIHLDDSQSVIATRLEKVFGNAYSFEKAVREKKLIVFNVDTQNITYKVCSYGSIDASNTTRVFVDLRFIIQDHTLIRLRVNVDNVNNEDIHVWDGYNVYSNVERYKLVEANDIVNNLTSSDSTKVLAASQGKAIKTLIDNLPSTLVAIDNLYEGWYEVLTSNPDSFYWTIYQNSVQTPNRVGGYGYSPIRGMWGDLQNVILQSPIKGVNNGGTLYLGLDDTYNYKSSVLVTTSSKTYRLYTSGYSPNIGSGKYTYTISFDIYYAGTYSKVIFCGISFGNYYCKLYYNGNFKFINSLKCYITNNAIGLYLSNVSDIYSTTENYYMYIHNITSVEKSSLLSFEESALPEDPLYVIDATAMA